MKIFDLFRRKKPAKSNSLDLYLRSFAAANNNRLIDWALSYSKINADLKRDYIAMTLRARDLARNNEFVIGYLENLRRNIVGSEGFTLQSKAKDSKFRAEIESLWREYNSRIGAFVSMDEHQSGRDFDVLVLRTLIIDGEVFIRRCFDPASRFGYRYEVLDSLEISPLYNVEDAGDGERVVMGVRYDCRGREKSFYLCQSKGDYYTLSGVREEIPAADILHIFRKKFSDQARGYTELAGIIMNLGQMDAYKEAEIVHARIQACAMGVWEWNGQSAGDLIDEVDDKGEFIREIKPGIFPVAPKGYTAKFLQNTSPNNQFGVFWKNMLRSIANALGISYNKAAGDYESVNYSSLREATLEDRASFEELQRFLIENWKSFQFADFIRALAMNEFIPVAKMTDCLPHKFFGRRFPWVDPVKEISAKEKEYDLLLTDPITELESRGIDPDELFDRWSQWQAKLKAASIPFMVRPSIPSPDQAENNHNQELS